MEKIHKMCYYIYMFTYFYVFLKKINFYKSSSVS